MSSTIQTERINSEIRANKNQRKRKSGDDDEADSRSNEKIKVESVHFKESKEKTCRYPKKSIGKRKALIEKKIAQFEMSKANRINRYKCNFFNDELLLLSNGYVLYCTLGNLCNWTNEVRQDCCN